jgi:ABC-type bacteriocin/lantibiotic exporter with double-glycine peptidase domain
MVLGYYGKQIPLDKIRSILSSNRDGSSALTLLKAARWYGLRGRGIKLDVGDLEYLKKGSILHWEFNHFVVFENIQRKGVSVLDPARGRRLVPMDQFKRSFTGVALALEPDDKFQAASIESHRVWRYAEEIVRKSRLLFRIVIISLLLQILLLAVPVLTGALVDRIVPRADHDLLLILGAGGLSIVLFYFLASLVRSHLLLHLRTHLDSHMALGFLEHLVDLPYAFFQKRSAGDLMMRLNSNSIIRETLTSNVLSGIIDGVMVSIYIVILLAANAIMGALVLFVCLLYAGVFLLSRRRYQDSMSQHLHTQARSQGYLVQMLSAIETLKASGSEPRAVEHWSNLFVDELNAVLVRGRLSATVDSLISSLRIGSPLIILWAGGIQVLDGNMSLGTMLALNALAAAVLTPVSTLIFSGLQIQTLKSYIERLEDVLETPPEQDRSKLSPADNIRGRITLEQVSFSYSPLAQPTIRDVTLEIEPGQKVAIVGRSGAGKSTLARLMLRLYEPGSGRILFDGLDLARVDLRSVRNQLGIVTQRSYLFGTTVRENIALSDPTLPIQQIIEAAKIARIHDDIIAMPMGYETILSDGGASLSGGQRQRIALARALVNRPGILLLDEATSELDAITEGLVHKNLSSLRATRIVIAHRLSTVADSDLILVMDEGKIVERGTHESLLAAHGAYEKLVSAQLKTELR